jgi:uncharacterized membrane protein YfcA
MMIAGYFLMALVGISLGLIGGGGSILTVPILVYAMGVNPLLATSYSLFIVGTTSMAGAANNYRHGFVDVKTALLFGISSISTVFITRKIILPAIPEVLFSNQQIHLTQSMAIMILFAVLMLSASIAMIKNNSNDTHLITVSATQPVQLMKLLLFGIAVGLTTGLLGAGGGFLLIPALVLLLKMPMKKAVGTSLLIIALNSIIGFTGDLGHFNIDWYFLIVITLIAVAGIFLGGTLAKKIDGVKLKKVFGWFVLMMGIYILLKEIFFTSPVH